MIVMMMITMELMILFVRNKLTNVFFALILNTTSLVSLLTLAPTALSMSPLSIALTCFTYEFDIINIPIFRDREYETQEGLIFIPVLNVTCIMKLCVP